MCTLMRRLLIMQKRLVTSTRVVFTRKVDRCRHLLHCQIANRWRLAAARWTVLVSLFFCVIFTPITDR